MGRPGRLARRVDPRPLGPGVVRGLPVSQITRFGSRLGRAHDGVIFAGEHTSTISQGYRDGAVESGERAFRQITSLVPDARGRPDTGGEKGRCMARATTRSLRIDSGDATS